MAIKDKEYTEQDLSKLIEKVEKDDLPTNIFETEETDPLVLLGKLNEIIAQLKNLRTLIADSDSNSKTALDKAIEALTKSTTALSNSITAKETADNALDKAEVADSTAIEAINDATQALSLANEALETAKNALDIASGGEQILERVEAVENEITKINADIIELTKMLSATEELAEQALPKKEFVNVATNVKTRYIDTDNNPDDYTPNCGGVENYHDNESYNNGEKTITHSTHNILEFYKHQFNTLYKFNENITSVDSNGNSTTYNQAKLTIKLNLDYICPVGKAYISFDPTDPASIYGGRWEELPSGYVLQSIPTTESALTDEGKIIEIPAGIPNITGGVDMTPNSDSDHDLISYWGAFNGWTAGKNYSDNTRNTHNAFCGFNFDASRINSLYKNDFNRVQPLALKVYMWRRLPNL